MRRSRLAGLFLAFALFAGAGLYLLMPGDPAKGPARPIRVAMGQTVGEFIAANGLKEGPGGPGQYTLAIDKLRDNGSLYFTDVWVNVHYEDGDFSLELPPGRILVVGQTGGVITDFDATLYERPYPFAEADRRAREFIDRLLKSGWKAQSLFYPKDEMDSNSTNNRKYYARMTSEAGNTLYVQLMDLSRAPGFDTSIPGSAPVTPSDPTPRFVTRIEVTATDELRDMRSETVAARLFMLRHQKEDSPGLRIWLDDPAWTPDNAGMKQVDVPNPRWDPQKPATGRKTFMRWQMPDGTTEPAYR